MTSTTSRPGHRTRRVGTDASDDTSPDGPGDELLPVAVYVFRTSAVVAPLPLVTARRHGPHTPLAAPADRSARLSTSSGTNHAATVIDAPFGQPLSAFEIRLPSTDSSFERSAATKSLSLIGVVNRHATGTVSAMGDRPSQRGWNNAACVASRRRKAGGETSSITRRSTLRCLASARNMAAQSVTKARTCTGSLRKVRMPDSSLSNCIVVRWRAWM